MALYLNKDKLIINLGDERYCLNLNSQTTKPELNKLLSLDNYILLDSNELYLSAKEEE